MHYSERDTRYAGLNNAELIACGELNFPRRVRWELSDAEREEAAHAVVSIHVEMDVRAWEAGLHADWLRFQSLSGAVESPEMWRNFLASLPESARVRGGRA